MSLRPLSRSYSEMSSCPYVPRKQDISLYKQLPEGHRGAVLGSGSVGSKSICGQRAAGVLGQQERGGSGSVGAAGALGQWERGDSGSVGTAGAWGQRERGGQRHDTSWKIQGCIALEMAR